MAERDGHMLPALDARIVLAQAAIDLGEPDEAAQHLAIALDGAREHHFANVLADAVVQSSASCARAAPRTRRGRSAGRRTSHGCRSLGGGAGGRDGAGGRHEPPAPPPRPLEELAREARAAVAGLSAPRAVPAAAR
jgi:hypothetical protein